MRLSLRSYGERVASHAHDFYQIVLPLVGTLDRNRADWNRDSVFRNGPEL